MALCDPFIRRPIGTGLIALGLLIVGAVAYWRMPVTSLPAVDFPTIRVSASWPGADPAIMAATVAAPLERRLGEISGVSEMTSSSTLGQTAVVVQFEQGRSIEKAARDVQAAINAAATDLPADMPSLPSFRKFNPASAPILILALTSDTLPGTALYDAADSVLAQRIAQIEGVADVTVAGAEQPAIRIRLDPGYLATLGLSLDTVRKAIVAANVTTALGATDGDSRMVFLTVNDQINRAEDYRRLMLRAANGQMIRLDAIADVQASTRNSRAAGWYNGKPSVSLFVTRQANANVVETVDRVKALLPELRKWIPAGVDVHIVSDRTTTIRASIRELQMTLAISIALVMAVVFVFLRHAGPTLAAGASVPLSLAGTFPLMLLSGFSIDIVSLMAIIVAAGFVVDDAIVMIENADRFRQQGLAPLEAVSEGARQIGFTVVSISLSLIAAFLPMMFIPGAMGKMFQEFAWTMAFAIAVSAVISLTVTPAMLGQMRVVDRPPPRWLQWFDVQLLRLREGYIGGLHFVVRRAGIVALSLILTLGATVWLFGKVTKGFMPQDDTGLLMVFTEASPDISFTAIRDLQERVNAIVRDDPAVEASTASIGASGWGSANSGRMFIVLKPASQRDETRRVIGRLRQKLANVAGMQVFVWPAQDVRAGGRSSKSQYQFSVWGSDIDELQAWTPRIVARIKQIPGLTEVSTDQEKGGLQTTTTIDRAAAARLGVKVADIDAALANAFTQRQISTIYGPRNQYRVILEVDPKFARTPTDISRIRVPGANGVQVPLGSLVTIKTSNLPVVVNHQGPFPAVTVTYALQDGVAMADAAAAIQQAVNDLQMPPSLRGEFAGDAKEFAQGASQQPWTILLAVLVVYIVLGVLYESLIHPITILSTLPSAALGALITLWVTGTELSVMAVIGIILLIGIVKKNGIMLVDFAIEMRRDRGMGAEQAILEACRERFRPILMTTLTAMLGALPLMLGTGPGAGLRQPLGLTIVGGLVASQILTLYTTPALYLVFERWAARWRNRSARAEVAASPAE